MNHCAIQQNSFASCDEIWASAAAAAGRSMEKKETVVCPKPRRLGLSRTTLDPTFARPLRWQFSHQQEDYDAKAGHELMDIILAKGGSVSGSSSASGSGSEQSIPQVASSPPFFTGSPPSRVSNPLIQDSRFGGENPASVSIPPPSGVGPSPSTRNGGCVRSNFGNNPAVRIEGFDCLDRDRRNCSILALA